MEPNIRKLDLAGLHDVKPGLERIAAVLKKLGSPNEKRDCVAVAGTNGKGSVAAAVAAILEASGYRTGLFTSPHLRSVTERIKVNGTEIAARELDRSLGAVFDACEALGTDLSYFELVTAACFLLFESEKTDIDVLETGMGGRWDATNVCLPAVSVITNVSLDHTEYLGDTVARIAAEKAGIIRKNGLVATACEGEALRVVEEASSENSAKCYRAGRDFFHEKKPNLGFDYSGERWTLAGLETSLAGAHQARNAATAVAAAELLDGYAGYEIDSGSIRRALREVRLEGRMEYVRPDVPVILDGAHNPAAAESLVESLEFHHPETKFNFLIAMLGTKDVEGFTRALSRVSGKLVVTGLPGNENARTAEEILKLARGRFDSAEIAEDPRDAYEKLLGYGEPACACGSLYLLGHLKDIIEDEKTGDSD